MQEHMGEFVSQPLQKNLLYWPTSLLSCTLLLPDSLLTPLKKFLAVLQANLEEYVTDGIHQLLIISKVL
jgi:hypothetical protein